MSQNNLALKALFIEADEETSFSAEYKNYLKEPTPGTYPENLPLKLRVGDHYNGTKTDIPFHDANFIPTIRRFVTSLNATQPESRHIYLYIPAHRTAQDRVLNVYCHDPIFAEATVMAFRNIFRSYRNDDLLYLNTQELVSDTLEEFKKVTNSEPEFKVAFITAAAANKMSANRVKDFWMNGGHIEASDTDPSEKMSTGRIKFHEDSDISAFQGESQSGYLKLTQFLTQELGIKFSPSIHKHCLDMAGEPANVHMAFLIGKQFARLVDEGIPFIKAQLRFELRVAKQTLDEERLKGMFGKDYKNHLQLVEAPRKAEREDSPRRKRTPFAVRDARRTVRHFNMDE